MVQYMFARQLSYHQKRSSHARPDSNRGKGEILKPSRRKDDSRRICEVLTVSALFPDVCEKPGQGVGKIVACGPIRCMSTG